MTGVQQNECELDKQFINIEKIADGNMYDTVRKCGADGLKCEQILACEPGKMQSRKIIHDNVRKRIRKT